MGVTEVKTNEQWATKLAESKSGFGGKPVVVDFSATWCGPCKMISPYFDELSSVYTNVAFLKVDVDDLPDVAQEQGVRAMPTFMAFYNGAKVDELVGADKNKLKDMIDRLAQRLGPTGPGRKVGGTTPAAVADDSPEARRAKLAAAAEARFGH